MPARHIPKYTPHHVVGNRLFVLAPRRYRRKVSSWKHTSERERSRTEGLPATLKILTWNVNFVWSWPDDRLNCILRYIQSDIIRNTNGRPEPCCLLLQEVHQKSLQVILKNDWIMEHFVIVPAEKEDFAELCEPFVFGVIV
jgi:tyrosyl-DNA phosphodiesterase 2